MNPVAGEMEKQKRQNPYSRLPDWFYPTNVVFWLGLFSIYGLIVSLGDFKLAAFGPYLSPFTSPAIEGYILPPALWIAWIPLSFRLTCYYYRKAYFRSFFGHPRSCAHPERSSGEYHGETRFWSFNSLHRFALYLTVAQVIILWYDVVKAFYWQGSFHFGLGTAIMLVNVVCLSGYTFGCHALRHLVGGGKDCLSCLKIRFKLWKGVTVLNVNHSTWAWVSLFTVWITDLYIRLLAHGWLPVWSWS